MQENADNPTIIRAYKDAPRPTGIELHQRRNPLIQLFKLASIGLTVMRMVTTRRSKTKDHLNAVPGRTFLPGTVVLRQARY